MNKFEFKILNGTDVVFESLDGKTRQIEYNGFRVYRILDQIVGPILFYLTPVEGKIGYTLSAGDDGIEVVTLVLLDDK